ncbi:MAG: radical SAM protein [Sedimenticola sp.]
MKIGLIAMSGVRVRNEKLAGMGITLPGFINRGEVIASLPSLGLLTVAALTPPDIEVDYIEYDSLPDENDLPEFDLVGISSFTARINAAYRLSAMFRNRGIPVVLGGIHVALLPDEAQQHANSIIVGGAEEAWPRLVEDFRKGEMQPRYQGAMKDVFTPENYTFPRFDLLEGRKYNRLTVQTSRGCPLSCDFCAASIHITSSYQQKPVDLVIEEIRAAKGILENPFFELADDNTFVNKKWSKEFLKKLIPEGIRWFTETDISVAEDDELLDLLAESGCRQVLIGLESLHGQDLDGMNPANWKMKKADHYLEAIDKIQSRGVTVNGCFVLGLDGHTADIFSDLKDYVEESKLIEVQITVMTPFPGTPLYDRLKSEGRLLYDEHWDRCTLFDVNYQPKNMSVKELEDGMQWLFGELYSEAAFQQRKRHYVDYVKDRM